MKFPLSMRYRSGSGGASLAVSLAVALLLAAVPVRAQRPAPKPAPAAATTTTTTTAGTAAAAPAAAQTPSAERNPSVTFDTLLSADAYGIYAEMRMLGRHANSQEFAQLLTPFTLEGSGAPAELLALYEFVKAHAEPLMSARMMFATMPARSGLPEMLLAVEMPSVEEARKFVPELRRFVAANIELPPQQQQQQVTAVLTTAAAAPAAAAPAAVTATAAGDTPEATRRRGGRRRAPDGARAKRPPAPRFQIKRAGTLIAMSGATFTFKDLHGAGEGLLVNEPGFQAARTRFSTDTLFVYFNTVRMASSSKQRMEALEKEYRRQEELARAEAEKRGEGSANIDATQDISSTNRLGRSRSTSANTNAAVTRQIGSTDVTVTMNSNMNAANANVATSPEDEMTPPPPTPEATPPPMSEKELEAERQREQSRRFADTLGSLVFGGRADSSESWPESIGVGASLEADALVVRGLFVSQSADAPVRPIPFLPVLLSGPSIAAEAPAVLPAETDIFLSVSLDLPQMYDYVTSLMKIADLAAAPEDGKGGFGEQLTAFEKANNFRIREELLAALGNEIAVGMPGYQFFGTLTVPRRSGDPSTPPPLSGPIVVIALNDREGLQKLLPRVLSAVGFAGATEQNVVEKHGQVEVLTFSNGTLAFIDRFLVGAPDAATMRRLTDAYNGGETLANSERFREPTRWQSKQAVGQVYVSNAMLKGMFESVTKSAEDIDDPAVRAYLMRLDPEPGAITHLATRESNGLMHELRLPKNLLSLFAASGIVSQKLSTIRGNESMAQWKLRIIHELQNKHKATTGRYGTLEELKASDSFDESYTAMGSEGYEVKLSASGDRFEATATPTGYPKLGRLSFYIDQTGIMRGADTGGKPASASAPMIGMGEE